MSRKSPKDPNFPGMEPIPRLHRLWIITEKIDGTNGLVAIQDMDSVDALQWPQPLNTFRIQNPDGESVDLGIWAGSKNQWLGPDGDNFGFGTWVGQNALELVDTLGPGLHRGEWWGSGIQTGYGLPKGEKRFSLFNAARWDQARLELDYAVKGLTVVPVLADGVDGHALNRMVNYELDRLESCGSAAAPGFMRPEGIIAHQPSSRISFKATIRNDDVPKGLVKGV